jgi:hypothetical protein
MEITAWGHTIFKFQIQHYGSASDLDGTWFAGQVDSYPSSGSSSVILFCVLPPLW